MSGSVPLPAYGDGDRSRASLHGPGSHASAQAPLFYAIDFTEYAFPQPPPANPPLVGPNETVTVLANLFDDASGALLTADNGDLADLVITYRTSEPGAQGTAGRPSLETTTGFGARRILGRVGYTGAPPTNNPGTRQWYEVEVRFACHLDVRELTLSLSSLNTAALAWEFSQVSFLDESYQPFSTPTMVPPYLAFGIGMTGPDGVGNFIAASTGTVVGVGTNLTSQGTSGTGDNVTLAHAGPSGVGLDGGQRIGGFVWRTTLEDVRGTSSGNTNVTASLFRLTIGASGGSTTIGTACDPDLAVVKSTSHPGGAEIGDEVTYTLDVSNAGLGVATGVVVTDALPPGVAFVSASAACFELAGVVTCEHPALAVGEDVSFTIVVSVLEQPLGSVVVNTATVASDQDDLDESDNVSSAEVIVSGLVLSKTVCNVTTSDCSDDANHQASVDGAPGDELEYRVAYERIGPPVFDVQVEDAVPADTDFLEGAFGPGGDVRVACPDGSEVLVATGPVTVVAVDLASVCALSTATRADGVTVAPALLDGQAGVVEYRVVVR